MSFETVGILLDQVIIPHRTIVLLGAEKANETAERIENTVNEIRADVGEIKCA